MERPELRLQQAPPASPRARHSQGHAGSELRCALLDIAVIEDVDQG